MERFFALVVRNEWGAKGATDSEVFRRFKRVRCSSSDSDRLEDVYPRVTNRIVSPSKSDRHVMFMAVVEQRDDQVGLYHSIDDDL